MRPKGLAGPEGPRLETLDARIDGIAARAETAGEDERIRYDEEIAALRMKQDAVGAKIRQLRKAGGAACGKGKGGALQALDDLGKAVERAIDRSRKSA